MLKTKKSLKICGKGGIIKMNKKQYNNVIENTLKHEQTDDSLSTARAIFDNMGVALPQGDVKTVYETISTNNYMGWKSCTMQDAQEAANNGTAAIGISEYKIVVLSAKDEEQPVAQTASVMTLDENTSAFAVDGLEYYSYSYGGTGQCGCVTPIVGYNTDYRGLQILTDAQLNLLNYNKPFYQSAANKYGIPWKMLAAIHYRETKLKRECPSNGDGPYQIWGKNYPVGPLTDAQFQSMTDEAAEFIKRKAGNRNLNNVENVKYTFFAYNGVAAAYKTQALNLGFTQAQANIGEGSPYVMNRADCWRDPTVEPTKSNRTWGQIKSDGGSVSYPANNDYGALVVYCAI